MFRLVQECLSNIHRHSGSKSASIRIARDADGVSLEVKDNGKGISPENSLKFNRKVPAWAFEVCANGRDTLAVIG